MQHGYIQGKLLPQPPSVLLLGFHGVEEGKFNDIRPDCGTGTPTQTADGNDRGKMGSVKKKEKKWERKCWSRGYYLRCCVQKSAAYLMSSNCRSSWLAWKIGLLVKSSPKIHLSHDRKWVEVIRKHTVPLIKLKWSLRHRAKMNVCQNLSPTGLWR